MPKGTPQSGARDTQNRRQILDILAEGPISDPAGLAIQQLQARTGHETTNALSKVLRQMEALGLIRRVVKGRRTFYIESLVGGPEAQPEPYQGDTVAPPAEDLEHAETLVKLGELSDDDLWVLGGMVLKHAARALTERTEAKASANQRLLDEMRRSEGEAKRRIAELEAEVRRMRDAAEEAEDRARRAEGNVQILLAQADKAKRRGATIDELITAQERKELAKLQRELPKRRG